MAGKISSKIKTRAQENTVGVIAGLVVLLVILLVAVVSLRIVSNNSGGSGNEVETIEQDRDFRLSEDAESNSVTVYVQRGVTADEKHYSVEMTVSAENNAPF